MKKWIAVLLLFLLPLRALGETAKEEVIYARLGLDGQVSALYVVNAFETDGEESLTDYGAYTSRTSLTDSRELPGSGDETPLALTPGRYSYQGNGLEKPLPWQIQLTATLNGQEVEPGALGGADGDVTLTLSVKNNPEAEPVSGYTLQITLSLDGALCRNIQAPGGTIALSGGSRQVTYALLPGMEADYTITFQAENFRMDGIQIGGVRMCMDAKMYAELFTAGMADPAASIIRSAAQSAIASMTEGEAVSFADSRNAVTRVQFVLVTDSIERPLSEPISQAETIPASQSFWQRLLALFGL